MVEINSVFLIFSFLTLRLQHINDYAKVSQHVTRDYKNVSCLLRPFLSGAPGLEWVVERKSRHFYNYRTNCYTILTYCKTINLVRILVLFDQNQHKLLF